LFSDAAEVRTASQAFTDVLEDLSEGVADRRRRSTAHER
jgi:hypothetical protein